MAEAGTDCAQDSTESSIVIFDISSDKRLFMDGNSRIILKYLKGDATPDERLQVMEWVRQSDANRKELETLRRIYDILLISEDDGRKSAGKGFRRILLKAIRQGPLLPWPLAYGFQVPVTRKSAVRWR